MLEAAEANLHDTQHPSALAAVHVQGNPGANSGIVDMFNQTLPGEGGRGVGAGGSYAPDAESLASSHVSFGVRNGDVRLSVMDLSSPGRGAVSAPLTARSPG